MKFPAKWLFTALFILWFFFIVASYFVVYKPFSPQILLQLGSFEWLPIGLNGRSLLNSALNLLYAGWFGAVALGNGGWLWGWVQRKTAVSLQTTRLEALLFAAGSGIGMIGLLVLLVGSLGGLGERPLAFVAIGLTLTATAGIRQLPGPGRWQRPPRPIAVYIIFALFLVTTLALLPPTNWDGLFYHLKGPKLYLQAGRIVGGIDIPHLNFPSLFQMTFLLAMGLRGDIAAQLVHWLYLPLLAGLVYGMATQLLGVKEGWTAVLFLLAAPMVLTLAAWSYNDLALAFYSVGALYAYLRWMQSDARSWLVWAGVFAGFAMSMKYTSFITPLFLGLMLLWQVRHRWRTAWREVLLFSGPALLVALPWYIKNFILTGNPVYPFLFDGLFWDSFRAEAYAEAGTGLGWDLIALSRLPYDMTLALQDASQDGLAGPLFLGFLPLILAYTLFRVGKRPLRPMRVILLYVFANYLLWVLGVIGSQALWQVRLFLPGLVALIAPMAWVYEAIQEWDHPQFSLRNFMNLALGFVLAMLVMTQMWGWLSAQPWAYLTGTESRDQFLTRRLGDHYLAMQTLNETLPENAVVAFLWEPRSYYCHLDCRPDSILDEFGHLVFEHETAVGITDAWRDAGVTHILLWRTGLDFVSADEDSKREPNLQLLQQVLENQLVPERAFDGSSYELYRVP